MWVEEAVSVDYNTVRPQSTHTHILLVIERLNLVWVEEAVSVDYTRCVHSPHTHSLSDREADILCG